MKKFFMVLAAVAVIGVGSATANGTCAVHNISYAGNTCPKCAERTANSAKRAANVASENACEAYDTNRQGGKMKKESEKQYEQRIKQNNKDYYANNCDEVLGK